MLAAQRSDELLHIPDLTLAVERSEADPENLERSLKCKRQIREVEQCVAALRHQLDVAREPKGTTLIAKTSRQPYCSCNSKMACSHRARSLSCSEQCTDHC